MAEAHMAFLIIGYNLSFISERAAPEWRDRVYEALKSLQTWLEVLGAQDDEIGLEVAGWIDKFDKDVDIDYKRLRRKARAAWWDTMEETVREYAG